MSMKRHDACAILLCVKNVGETGFEPATLCSQSRCATGLRYSPNNNRTMLHCMAITKGSEQSGFKKIIIIMSMELIN